MGEAGSLKAVERSLAFGSKMLVGGLASGGGGFLAAILHMAGSVDKVTPPAIGMALPPNLAALALTAISLAFGYAAWWSLRQARNTLRRIFLSNLEEKETKEFDETWMKDVQTILAGCSPIVTSPAAIRSITSFSTVFIYSNLTYIYLPHLPASIFSLIIFFVGLTVISYPYSRLVVNHWLVMFKPSAYDYNGSIFLKKAYMT